MASINKETLKKSTGASDANAGKFLSYINSSMRKYSINTPERILAFLSQIGHESDHLKTTIEYASGEAYEGRSDLGNTQAGDGKKFVGRGIIQVTGRSNYQQVSKALGRDFINNPELLEQPKYAVEASAWWWKNHGLNEVADTMDIKKPLTDPINQSAFERITKIINGGKTGLQQREDNWKAGQNSVIRFVKEHPVATTFGILTFVLAVATTGYWYANRDKINLRQMISGNNLALA
jgi:putative chitinase